MSPLLEQAAPHCPDCVYYSLYAAASTLHKGTVVGLKIITTAPLRLVDNNILNYLY